MPALDRKHLNALRTACSMPHALISPGPACPPSQSSCSVLPLRLPDAHCHPQQGPDSQERLQRVQAPAVAVMGVSEGDWERVLELQRALPRKVRLCKVIPCLGIHPWYAHLHAPLPLPHPTVPALLPPASTPPSGMEPHSGKDPDTSPSTQRPPLSAYPPTPTSTASPCSPPLPLPPPASHSPSPSSNSQNGIGLTLQQLGLLDLPQGTDRDQEAVRQLLASCPSVTWAGRLRQLLTEVPGAVLGECGLDRAAVVPGTKASQSLPHQLSLLRTQLALAAQLQRPASLHCVRATGHMMALLSSTPAEELPPRIMLHSFNGPPDSIKQLLALPRGVGSRLYFSFSATINARSGAGRDKLVARIRAVPQDRLLAETDEDDAGRMDAALGAVLQLVAEARGWTAEQATELLTANFEAFYDTFLPPGYVMLRRVQAGPEAAPKNPALGEGRSCLPPGALPGKAR
ncbi:TatD family [Haematococcus lacustris]